MRFGVAGNWNRDYSVAKQKKNLIILGIDPQKPDENPRNPDRSHRPPPLERLGFIPPPCDYCNLQQFGILLHCGIMKTEPKSNAVIRLDPATHRQAKILAATEGLTLTALVGLALQKELRRRARNERNRAARAE